ncbi:hypothetical protein OQA88_5247 [Cercophora sp. LCS_1]
MDYTKLKLSDRQIRLLTILPPAFLGNAPDHDAPVHCWMHVRKEPLPPAAPVDTGVLPANYISFDHYVEQPPAEYHVQEMREMLAPHVHRLENSLGSRLFGKGKRGATVLRTVGLQRNPALTMTTNFIINLLDADERIKLLTAIDGPDNERRIWSQSGDIRSFEDDFGHSTLLFSRDRPRLKHTGVLGLEHMNHFFRLPGSHPTTRKKAQSDNYIAMSYAWGPPEPTTRIFVNGEPVKVRRNLEAALRRFRRMEYFSQGGGIWIDALCIDQDDLIEQQSQVQMMADIYRNAGNMIVWLGDDTDSDTELAIDVLEALSVHYRAEYFEFMDRSDPLMANTWRTMAQVRIETAYGKARQHMLTNDITRQIQLPLLFRFFDRPYWRRLWIIQELCMGRSGMPIVCGDRVTQWRYIRDGVLMSTAFLDLVEESAQECMALQGKLWEHSLLHVAQIAQLEIRGHRPEIAPIPTHVQPLVARSYFESGPLLGNAIRRAIVLASQSSCFRQHDRIYGILSIPGLPDFGLKVDYSKKLAVVYTEFTAACVQNKNLDFFALLDGGYMSLTDENGNSQEPEKPSWVPEYGAKPARRIGTIDGEWHAGGYVPVGWRNPPEVLPEEKALVCMGKVVDTVDGLGGMSKADLEAGSMVLTPDNDLSAVVQPTNSHSDGRKDSVIHDVLVGGTDRNGMAAPDSFKCLHTAFPAAEPPKGSPFYRNWHFLKSSADLLINGQPLSSYFFHLSSPDESGTAYLEKKTATAAARQAMAARTKMRRLIVTSSGLLGLAPGQSRQGDAVITIVGHGKPLIARKVDTFNGHDIYYLLGEAYVDGMMNAQKLPLSTKRWHADETYRTSQSLEPIVFV